MASLFTHIIQGKIPAHIIAEDKQHIAFLDIHPIATGHTLVVPKQEVDYLFDLPDSALAALICFAKQVAIAIRSSVPCKRISMHVQGLEVPHAHVHLVPIKQESDPHTSSQRKSSPSSASLVALAQKIKNNIHP